MATLICWASGLLQTCSNNKVPDGVVPVAKGLDSALRHAVIGSKHVEYVKELRGHYVTAVRAIPKDDQESRFAALALFQEVFVRQLKDKKRRMK